ncbi:Glycerol dehydrogenase large subunit precursor [Pseudooceanicola marinus]|uniref:Glycerol dehydrogenase large subunit n=1 Tax=Pseudooceanicola marinus TaxID=396013 RepID=A0A1X7A691_9RHOB|nr:pyrroloquinoline quinone-dependent dehydrogenase [Pseudooceanicola marinus]PJE27254.1 pyrroloquinoline quinone-dependent dehydrogenase [Pseudooceanicola marinus]SLN71290.1 Glycerol dehydrogenase large subunit precursor [Pseudooceanicola marinus]
MTRFVPLAAAVLLAGTLPLQAQQATTPDTQQPANGAAEDPSPTEDAAVSPPPEEQATEEATADGAIAAAQPPREVGSDWPYWGGDAQATRYSPLDQITPENVGQLEQVFTFHTGDLPKGTAEGKYSPEVTPLKVGDDLLMCSAMNILISVDAATGEENWRFDPGVPNQAIPYGATCRGVSVYSNPDAAEDDACATRVIQGTLDAKLVAVDVETGAPCEDFGENGAVDMWQDIGERVPGWYAVTAPPAIVRGVVVTGAQVKDGQAEDAPSGVIRGYDAVTGELAWAWDLAAPDENRNGPPEGEVYTRGTPNMWTTAVADEELGLVYLPMGNSSVDYYGSNRSDAENEYATSLVALDATTGEEAWHFQTVRHDVWDYDLGSQASLIDYQGTPAVLLPSKQGDIYILNRETGEPLTPVGELTDLPKGEVEPDFISDTQPVSEWHTLRKDPLEEKDMWGFTPIDQLWCRIQFRRANYDGFFTPPSTDKPWIQYPGYNGGSDWGSVAVDTDRGIIIANYNDVPNYNRLVPRDEVTSKPINEMETGESGGANAEGAADPQAGSPYGISVNAGWRNDLTGVPCTRPPYGGIRAIDLETGETLWDRPLGTARRNGPFGIPSFLPFDIGTPNNGGSVVTAGGLVFIAAATDNLFRAINIETGETVWSTVLPAGGQANPITYEVDGRQYVMVSAMGHHFMETPVGDEVIAWALPEN